MRKKTALTGKARLLLQQSYNARGLSLHEFITGQRLTQVSAFTPQQMLALTKRFVQAAIYSAQRREVMIQLPVHQPAPLLGETGP